MSDVTDHTPVTGALWAVLATICFTVVDVIIKFLSGDYPLYQITFLRTLVALTLVLGLTAAMTGSLAALRTNHLKMQLLRGGFVVTANFLFFTGLAALPLAETVAIFFVGPLLISIFSVVFLGDRVGPRRWAAVAVGLIGVLIVLRPGTEAFQLAALLPIGSATCYAFLHILTRKIGTGDSVAALLFYTQLVMLVVSVVAGLAFGHGAFDVFDHPSAAFLLRAWSWPNAFDIALIVALGTAIATGGYAISAAYRRSEPAFIAPFEYIAMPVAVLWGIVIFAEYPELTAYLGIGLILVSGLVLIWREAVARRQERLDAPGRF